MARYSTPVYAPPPKYMQHQTDIRAPSVRTHWVDGRAKYTFIPPEIGPIRILDSDDEGDIKPVMIRAQTPNIKREHSDSMSRPLGRGQSQGGRPRIKRETSANNLERHRIHRIPSFDVEHSRQLHNGVQSHVSFDGGQLEGSSDNLSSSSSDSASSSPGFEFDESSTSSSDEADSDVYAPSKSPSRISSTSPRTRQQTAREATVKLDRERTSRAPSMAEVEDSAHVPLDFYIDLPGRGGQSQTRKGKASIPQSSSQKALSPQVRFYDTHDWQATDFE